MKSARKTGKFLSALSMAAVAALSAKAAHGMTLTMYYGNDPSYANSNNAIIVGTGLNPTGPTDAAGGREFFSGHTNVAVTGGVQTITIPVGDYVSLAIDALLTGNVNADAGVSSGSSSASDKVQPSYLGLSGLDVYVPSTNTHGNILSPIALSTHGAGVIGNSVPPYSGTVYQSSAQLNESNGAKKSSIGSNGGAGSASYNSVPDWTGVIAEGGIEPNNAPGGWNSASGANPSPDSGTNASGNLGGIITDPGGGNGPSPIGGSNTTAGIQQLTMFAASTAQANAAPAYANATEFVDSLIYQGLSAGLVTLSPVVNTGATAYWFRTIAGTSSSPTVYATQGFNATSEKVQNVPNLVIDVVAPVIALSATAGASYGSTVGNLSITGSAATGYTTAEKTGLSSTTGNVGIQNWNASSDPEIYGVDVEVNGVQATATQLAVLAAAIDGSDGTPSSLVNGLTIFTGAANDPSAGKVLASLDTGTGPTDVEYNLFLDYTNGGFAPSDNLGIDLSSSNDSNLVGYTFTAVSVVPEPMSLSLLALGGIGLTVRRPRRVAVGSTLRAPL
jgi:hypothetical protein